MFEEFIEDISKYDIYLNTLLQKLQCAIENNDLVAMCQLVAFIDIVKDNLVATFGNDSDSLNNYQNMRDICEKSLSNWKQGSVSSLLSLSSLI